MSVMRICLFNPVDIPSYPPLNLTYLSAYLKQYGACEVVVRLVDMNCTSTPLDDILAWQPDIVGFTSFSPKALDIYALAKELKQRSSDLVLVCGGVHATILPEEVIERGRFDVAVIGEGECTFTELVNGFAAAGKKLDAEFLATVRGIAFRSPEGIHRTPPRELIIELDTIPHPDRGLLDNDFYSQRFFIQRGMNSSRVSTIAASRGCPYHCIYCCVNFTARNRLRFHSAAYVADEMEQVVAQYGIKWLFFTDDTFLVDKHRTRRLCEEILHRGLAGRVKWEVQVRSNLATWKDLELLKLMRAAGCAQIDYGFETGSQRVLTQIKGPGITLADHTRAIEVTR
ncbi:MAG: radical SAM protein, partial [Desulfobacterales bacterium]|nr:radical SAM protein [Desulfobacterales bacterium]